MATPTNDIKFNVKNGLAVGASGIQVINTQGEWVGTEQSPYGATGAQGPTGASGILGASGHTGASGIEGIIGDTGITGGDGHQGATGLLGSTGALGASGISGATGEQGYQGATGLLGSTGADGASGIQGASGADGYQGATGEQGYQGSDGEVGIDGASGADGAQGSTGAQGIDGASGPEGQQGQEGLQGATGGNGGLVGGGLTFDPSYTPAGNINLLNGNTTAELNNAGYYTTLGSTALGPTDKIVFGFYNSYDGGLDYLNRVGLSTHYANLINGALGGADDNSVGIGQQGYYYFNNSATSTDWNLDNPNWAQGDYIDVAVDMAAKKFWVRVNGGYWNDNPSDPATGSGGYTIPQNLIDNGPVYPAITLASFNYIQTYDFQQTAQYALPSGFTFLGAGGGSRAANQGIDGASGPTGETGATGPHGARYHTTSTTTLNLTTGATGLVVADDHLNYSAGQVILITDGGGKHIHATVDSYDANTKTLNFTPIDHVGTGSASSWEINLDGAEGIVGASGATGASGVQGPIGPDGTQGSNFLSVGSTGLPGATGIQGASGVDGIDGASGATGFAGASGASGIDGASGADGYQGATGLLGATGAVGDAGIDGASGADGVQGATGILGSTGAVGEAGIDGASGADGVQGSTGAKGYQGSTGSQGYTGDDGATGVIGSTGAQGGNGSTYLSINAHVTFQLDNAWLEYPTLYGSYIRVQGPLSDITPGMTVTYGGHTYTVYKYIENNSNLSMLEFTNTPITIGAIPAGADIVIAGYGPATNVGYTGSTGASGVQGPIGNRGYTGRTGATGIDGASGVTGASGPTGRDGATGVLGISAATGPTGQDGATGIVGIDAATGPTGQDGATGITGATGYDGASGPTGETGIDGASGSHGLRFKATSSNTINLGTASGNISVFLNSDTYIGYDYSYSATQDVVVGIDHLNYLVGKVVSYDNNTGELVLTVLHKYGTATGYAYINLDGAVGQIGASGATGYEGATGYLGASGATGAPGASGYDGASGPTGEDGAQGRDGASGITGSTGPTGQVGATGVDGAQGTDGASGVQGASGATGFLGATGFGLHYGSTGLSGTSQQTIEVFATNQIGTAKYLIQGVDADGNVQVIQMILTQNSAGAYVTEYATLNLSAQQYGDLMLLYGTEDLQYEVGSPVDLNI